MGPEAKIEESIRKYAERRGVLCYKFSSPAHRGVPDEAPLDTCWLELDASPDVEAKARRDAWLGPGAARAAEAGLAVGPGLLRLSVEPYGLVRFVEGTIEVARSAGAPRLVLATTPRACSPPSRFSRVSSL